MSPNAATTELFNLLSSILKPIVEKNAALWRSDWRTYSGPVKVGNKSVVGIDNDPFVILKWMDLHWNEVFFPQNFDKTDRGTIQVVLAERNRLAHPNSYTEDDFHSAYFAIRRIFQTFAPGSVNELSDLHNSLRKEIQRPVLESWQDNRTKKMTQKALMISICQNHPLYHQIKSAQSIRDLDEKTVAEITAAYTDAVAAGKAPAYSGATLSAATQPYVHLRNCIKGGWLRSG